MSLAQRSFGRGEPDGPFEDHDLRARRPAIHGHGAHTGEVSPLPARRLSWRRSASAGPCRPVGAGRGWPRQRQGIYSNEKRKPGGFCRSPPTRFRGQRRTSRRHTRCTRRAGDSRRRAAADKTGRQLLHDHHGGRDRTASVPHHRRRPETGTRTFGHPVGRYRCDNVRFHARDEFQPDARIAQRTAHQRPGLAERRLQLCKSASRECGAHRSGTGAAERALR